MGSTTDTTETPAEDGDQQRADEREGMNFESMAVGSTDENVDAGDDAQASSEAGYSSFYESDEEASRPLITPSFTAGEKDGRTNKQKYLDLKHRATTVSEEAKVLAQRRHEADLQFRLQAQQTNESWHNRIHRDHTELERHRRLSASTAESVIDMALYREAWMKGMINARARAAALDEAFSSAFGSLLARTFKQEEAAAAVERQRAKERAEACETVWDAAREGVPVQTLRELMERNIDRSRIHDASETFEQLCRRVEGIVVESRHPYLKGVRQDVEAYVPNAESFYVAFDPASNATMGMGKVALQEFNAKDPAVFFPRGPYNVNPGGEARLPGVNGEPPMLVEGSSVLVTFSASYWKGIAPAGDDYGWRLVCFTASGGDEARALVAAAERAAIRAAAVDAVNANGETCLHVASFEGNVAAARYLLSVDADPNIAHTASGYNTPLHEAARGGSLAVTRLLLKSSANVLTANSHGDYPLHVACRDGHLDIARRLLAHDSEWATVTGRNHAGLRASEVVIGSSALSALLKQVEASAAGVSRVSNTGASIFAAGAANASSSPALLFKMEQAPPHQREVTKRGAVASGGGGVSSLTGGGRGGGGAALRRCGVVRNKKPAGGKAGASSEHSAKALLSGTILPRCVRLARPLDDERHQRRQRTALDGRALRHGRPPWQHGGRGTSDKDEAEDDEAERFASEESEAQSVAGWSGTTFGASLTESDFGIPAPPAEVVMLPAKTIAGSAAKTGFMSRKRKSKSTSNLRR